jgi:hypothetical protein
MGFPESTAKIFMEAGTAAGGGTVEEQLIRLMVWVGAKLPSRNPHTRIVDPIAIINSGTAWCDQQVKVFLFLAWKLLKVPGRELAIYHSDEKNGHTVCEVRLNRRWCLFDVHTEHQAVYRGPDGRLLGHADLCRCSAPVAAEGHWWKGNNGIGKEGFYPGSKPAMVCPAYGG